MYRSQLWPTMEDEAVDRFVATYLWWDNPGQQLSIDESMIGTKCRLSFIQYLQAKPTKWGIKMWVCSDAATWYILSFSIYTGKDPNLSISPNGLAYDVVMRLLENKFNKGYSVFVDNFYTSPNLFLYLFNKGVSGTGTVRTNRKNFPSELREAWDKKPPHQFFVTMVR